MNLCDAERIILHLNEYSFRLVWALPVPGQPISARSMIAPSIAGSKFNSDYGSKERAPQLFLKELHSERKPAAEDSRRQKMANT